MSEVGPESDPFMQLAEVYPDNPADLEKQNNLDSTEAKSIYTPQSGTGNPKADYKAWDPVDQTFDF